MVVIDKCNVLKNMAKIGTKFGQKTGPIIWRLSFIAFEKFSEFDKRVLRENWLKTG